ncbi:hypothetical protein [Streptomyces sp. MA15]|uniref:hypothetical protein n=1 Tax=Streptomyces sp. MA15 TaxID=3055061 RepID=UPI0025B2712F|nr:hypothetical protein [Streptomyces sp. MA15]MDN3267431.1 hypothetical protein [Streptomyces sp. MA15]
MSSPGQQPRTPASAVDMSHGTAEETAPASAGPFPVPPGHPPTASGSRWARLPRGAVLAIGVGLGAAVVGACWAGVSLAEGSEGPFSTDGTLTVAGIGAGLDPGELCSGTGGYSDIDFGTQVNVTDAAGTLVAVGSLGLGEKKELGCEFPFTVADITPGSKFYTVEVSHRGGLTQTEDELRAGGLAFSLGD